MSNIDPLTKPLTALPAVFIPVSALQELIGEHLTRHDNVRSTNKLRLTKLRQIKQGLMHDLLTGRVRVK